jgi:hypothetical protein
MIRKSYPWLLLVVGVLIGLVISGRLVLLAQDRAKARPITPSRPPDSAVGATTAHRDGPAGIEGHRTDPPSSGVSSIAPTVQDLLLRPYRFSFARPTSLTQVCAHLRETLKVPVVLDQAALKRQEVEPEDTVQLELDGVRLKTGLKLLLDQVGLTAHVVAEDNLLVLTDREGSEDPLDRIWTDLRALHRDVHDVQDALDELTELLGVAKENGEGPRVRKPTIIEEMPDKDRDQPPEAAREKPGGAVRKPQGAPAPVPAPVPGPRGGPARVPLGGTPRRSL